MMPPPETVFRSTAPFDPERIHGAAIYCSDGRFGEQCDDFLMNGLGMPRYDRVALPGGPGTLAGHPQATLEHQGVKRELRFLVEVHRLDRIVLISHHRCAFYAITLGIPDGELEARQFADLRAAATDVREITGVERIETYFARPHGEGQNRRVEFERV